MDRSRLDLLRQYLAFPDRVDGQVFTARAHLVVGGVPDSLQTDLPVPPRSILLGSVWMDRDPDDEIAIIFKSELDVRELWDYYNVRLSNTGWRLNEDLGDSPDVLADHALVAATFFAPTLALEMRLLAWQSPGEETNLHLFIKPDFSAATKSERHELLARVTPRFAPEEDLKVFFPSVSWVGNEATQHGWIETQLPLPTVLSRLRTQLEAQGWLQVDSQVQTREATVRFERQLPAEAVWNLRLHVVSLVPLGDAYWVEMAEWEL